MPLFSPSHLLPLLRSPQPLHKLHQLLAQLLANPCFTTTNPSLLPFFLSSCVESRHLPLASLLLTHLPTPSTSLWNSVLRALSTTPNACQDSLSLYGTMLRNNIAPNRATFLFLLRCCIAFSKASKIGGSIHCQILGLGFDSDRFLQTGLLDFYAKSGCLDAAEKMFLEMPQKDAIAHNAMIAALSAHGRVDDARRVFDGMPEKSSASWNSMITCYCKQNDLNSALDLFNMNPVRDVISWNAMIDGYCKLGHLAMAQELFDQMGVAKNSVTWNTMISGYLHHRQFGTAIFLFRRMQAENVRPTEVTMVSLLSACAHLGALDMGRWIHAYIKNHNLRIDVVLGNALIDMYFKCGCVETALDIFHCLPMKNVYCWNSVIAGFGMHGYGEQAIEMFLEMEGRKGVKPDGVTFVGLLSGCSHSGLVSEGKRFFSQMSEIYGIEPMIEHYGCMVDLLGWAGLLKEALHLIETMAIQPNAVVWGSLLRACRIHKDTTISEEVTRCLLQLDPNDGANYVFLSNIYASANRWDDVESCRRIMIEKGVRKIPGCSSIEIDNVVHEFVAGDTSHPQFELIHAFMIEVERELRKLGYCPNTDSVLHDIGDEEKEDSVKYHSEKIAIAFGLMSTRDGKPIRVVKNLRVCGDFHEATKFIAKLFQRERIVRDRNRFHHFRDGTCSCKDHW